MRILFAQICDDIFPQTLLQHFQTPGGSSFVDDRIKTKLIPPIWGIFFVKNFTLY